MKFVLNIIIFCMLGSSIAAGQGVKRPTKTSVKDSTGSVSSGGIKAAAKPPLFPYNDMTKMESAGKMAGAETTAKKYTLTDSAYMLINACDFEKDANAIVLYNKAFMICGLQTISTITEKKIKILNQNGKDQANIHIAYNNRFGAEKILAVEGNTANLVNGKVIYTNLDTKLIYGQHTDKGRDEIVFTMPDVKAGSIITYRYVWERPFSRNVPSWCFDEYLPTLYSQFEAVFSSQLVFSAQYQTKQPFVKDTIVDKGWGHLWALANVPSLKKEAYMRSEPDELQRLTLLLTGVKVDGAVKNLAESWPTIAAQLAKDKAFYKPYDQSLPDEEILVQQAQLLKADDERIRFIFGVVRDQMKWNENKSWFSEKGIKAAWKNKSGNWGEINMTLCHLLKLCGIKAYPMLVSTRDNGRLYKDFVNIYQINKLVVYVSGNSGISYTLDATDEFNSYNQLPVELLDCDGILLDKDGNRYELINLNTAEVQKQGVYINAEIKADGSMTGVAEINSYGYNKRSYRELYKESDEKSYKSFLANGDNSIRIKSFKYENAGVDSLPLKQTIDFTYELPGTDERYIYFNPNLFTSLSSNPFLTPNRSSNVDLGYLRMYVINGRYRIPDGYMVDAMPKMTTLVTPDKSITFKRIIGEQDGYVLVNYLLNFKKTVYSGADYPDLYAYFKKMIEVLNEQVVFKKQ